MLHAWPRLVVVTGFVLAADLPAQRAPRNLDFEDGKVDQAAPGWFVPTRDCRALVVKRKGGKGLCLQLSRQQGNPPNRFGNVLQAVDATPYRGKTIRFSAEARSVGQDGRAQLWLRVDRLGGRLGFFENMADRPITDPQWKRYVIVGKVHDDATSITFGLMLLGGRGSAFLDAVELEIVDESTLPKVEGPRPLAARGLENVIVFTRLLGYVRYFHPSDQVAQVDWDRFTIEGIRKVEPMAGPEELAATLEELFAPVAPAVRVAVGKDPPLPEALRNARHDLRNSLPDALSKRPDAKDILLVSWLHEGVQPLGGRSVYRSRIVQAIPGDITARKFPWFAGGRVDAMTLPSPGFPVWRTLPGNLHCMVPLSLYKDKQGTLPHASGTFPRNDVQARLTADDRATRLAAVALGWNVFQHFYPYFDVVEVDWEQVLRTSLQEAATDKDPAEFLRTLRRMVARLQDGHGCVTHVADPNTGTLPVEFAWAGEQLVIERVDDQRAPDVHPGDLVVNMAGDMKKLMAELRREISAATPQFRRYQLAQRLRRGPAGKQLELELATPDGRKTVVLSYAAMFRPLPEKRPDKIAQIKPGIWYVDVSRIGDQDFTGALHHLAKARGIVFDFRGYPARLNRLVLFRPIIQKTVNSADWLVPTPRYPDRDRMKFKDLGRWWIRPTKPHLAARKVFLIDGRAISYAESCMGIVEHYKLGEIVGEATAGTNGNINSIRLPGGYQMIWTGMKVLKQDGSRHHGVGIQPTIKVERTVAGIRAGRDEFLEKALAILQNGK